ncbi:MAG: hypothetical protein HKN79_07395 [Flavobacteriales bacterium]|nr:hypothetical protein [Flavobacteriales bacterium]
MKADIERPEVTEVGVAIIKEENEEGELVWNSYLINMKDHEIEGVLVSSKGYGEIKGEKRETSMLRHFLDEVPAKSHQKIERIIEEVFGLFNEYWVSFYDGGKMYDKKYIFVPEAISEENFIEIPFVKKKGVLIV